MNHTAMPRAERLSEAFERFNRTSVRLSASYRTLAEQLRDFTEAKTDAGPRIELDAGILRGILDALPAAIILIDGHGQVRQCNAAARELLGVEPAGRLWRELIGEIFVPGDGVDGLKLSNGRVVTVATAPLGSLPGQVVMLHDVTDQRLVRALAERRQRLSALGEMTASLSHQIRTPLASSLLYLSQLEGEDIDAATRRRCCAKIRACLAHLDSLSRDMLVFAGGGALNAENFTIKGLLDEFRQLSAALIEQGRVRLEIIDDSRGAGLRGNRSAILTVLQNLVENAIQACADAHPDRPGNLRLLIRRSGGAGGIDAIDFLLSDDGPGIPEELRARVFEPFFTTRRQGTGLGLAVARAVAQAHGGEIWIESETGVGATVGMRYPAVSWSDR